MKILIVSQYFYPENFKGNDIAFELQKRGYDVTVLTGIPNYPKGIFFNGYGYFKKRREIINGVKVIRTFLLPRGKSDAVALFLNYFSWALFGCLYAVYLSLFKKFDRIFVQQLSPVTMGLPAIVYRKIRKTPVYFWVLDLWPESLVSAGGVNSKVVLNIFTKIVKLLYKNSDKILISSKGFRESIIEKGNFGNKIIYFPNWADLAISENSQEIESPKPNEDFKIMFAGNIGVAQDFDTVLEAFSILKQMKHISIKLIILGEGREKERLEIYVERNQLNNMVYFLGKKPIETMAQYFAEADCMLVSLKDASIFNLTLPAKVQAYMSQKKPIIAMMNGEGFETILEANCGFAVKAGDAEGLATTIIESSALSKELLTKFGENGYNYYLENFRFENCIDHLEKILK